MTTPAAGPGRAATIVRTKPADGDLNDRVFLDAQLTAEAISRSGLAVAQVDLATHIAEGVPGVKSVQNTLTLSTF